MRCFRPITFRSLQTVTTAFALAKVAVSLSSYFNFASRDNCLTSILKLMKTVMVSSTQLLCLALRHSWVRWSVCVCVGRGGGGGGIMAGGKSATLQGGRQRKIIT